jgi:hypothetical protein
MIEGNGWMVGRLAVRRENFGRLLEESGMIRIPGKRIPVSFRGTVGGCED